MNTFNLEIVTPETSVYAGTVQSVQVPGTNGSFQVLVNHAPIISTLGRGKVKVVTETGETLEYHTEDGVVEVMKNKAIILVERLLED